MLVDRLREIIQTPCPLDPQDQKPQAINGQSGNGHGENAVYTKKISNYPTAVIDITRTGSFLPPQERNLIYRCAAQQIQDGADSGTVCDLGCKGILRVSEERVV